MVFMQLSQIEEISILTSIPIHVNNSKNVLNWIGSGCFINYKEHYVFLTVLHVVKRATPYIWSDFDPQQGCKLIQIYPVPFASYSLKKKRGHLKDFAFQVFSDIPNIYYLENDKEGNLVRSNRYTIKTNLNTIPNADEEYAFAGFVNADLQNNPIVNTKFDKVLSQELKVYSHLKYVKSSGDYHIFKLPNNDYESCDLQGTSGAPILDSKGNLVSLVSRGRITKNGDEWFIQGIDLSQIDIKTVLDIATGQIK